MLFAASALALGFAACAPENPAARVKPLTMKRATLPPPIELENDNGIV